MFSYFKDGIKDCTPHKKISIEALIKEIRKNDDPIIRQIRDLNHKAADYETEKKKLKQYLPYITPCCTVSYRDDDHITEFTGYMYFDIDHVDNAAGYKEELIEQYKKHIGMICLSCSGRGLSIFTKVENEVNKSNFSSIREYICNSIFHDLHLDPKTKIKSNAWFVSYDPECYFNPSATIEVPEEYIITEENTGVAFHTINNPLHDCVQSASYQYKLISITEVINKLKFKTEVQVENKVFDMKPVEYCEVFITNKYQIPKGDKQAVFAQVIHNLLYLNPDVEPDYIFSYINWLNSNKTVPGTEASMRDLLSFFNMVYSGIKNTGLRPKTRIKYFHCRDKTISPMERRILSRKLTAMYRKYESINKVLLAKEILKAYNGEGDIHTINTPPHDCVRKSPSEKRITQKEVFQLINDLAEKSVNKGMSLKTIKRHWNVGPIDMEEVVRMENEKIVITYIPKIGGADEGNTHYGEVSDTRIHNKGGNEYVDQQCRL